MHIVRLVITPPKKSVSLGVYFDKSRISIAIFDHSRATFDFDTSLSELGEKLLNKIDPNFSLLQRGRGIE